MGVVLNIIEWFPLEVALFPGLVLFAMSLLIPRRIVSLTAVGSRRSMLLWTGIVGSLAIVVVASITSWINQVQFDVSGFDGWWRRPAPLMVAILIMVIAALVLRKEPRPAPGERAITPRRTWHAFALPALLWGAGITSGLLVATTSWQILIATSAPEEGPFIGRIMEYTPLPIFMDFNGGNGFAPGAGWPNHLATLLAVMVAIASLVMILRADANRPLPARSSTQIVKAERESTARLISVILLAALITTLGAVWMHTGVSGQTLAGYDQVWGSPESSMPIQYIGGSYSGIARELNLTGYALQGVGVALALRVAFDTLRAHLTLKGAVSASDRESKTTKIPR